MKAIRIPADQAEPIAIVEVGHDWRSMARAIGEPCEYIERALCPLSPEHGLVIVVDENGLFNGQPTNTRAWPLYPVHGYHLHGTVLVVAEGLTKDGPDFVDLPDPEQALRLVETFI